ncbi:Hypothetical predicted protein [Pelobates cultripes]|uniref:Uncharacterized protein n=1 Tax=Pelobates cultripes TaxID=61616 RepID=A0AAD1WQD5_PELCU|nr:Hypothetical predicted protein [Pelobates cultripes]
MDKRQQEDSCYYCGEKWHRITYCQRRPPKSPAVAEPKIKTTETSTPIYKDTNYGMSDLHKTNIPTFPPSADSPASYDSDEGSVEMDYNAPPSDGMRSFMSECPEPMVATMTTIPISWAAVKKNTVKHHLCAPGLVKNSDGTIIPREKLTNYERYLAEKRFVEANPLELSFKQDPTYTSVQPATMGIMMTTSKEPPEDTFNQVSTCSSSQPVISGMLLPIVTLVVKSGLIKNNNEPISTLRRKENSISEDISPDRIRVSKRYNCTS